jgi:AcrR family transcriptional regulator
VNEAALTAARVLEAAELVLRRHGPAKATVVDVARALGVSHGSVYRHFPSKAALRDAVVARWLAEVSAPLAAIAEDRSPAAERLARWLGALIAAKRQRLLGDPELFATYVSLAGLSREVVTAHVAELTHQLGRIIADGIAAGDFAPTDPARAARAVFDATARFHNPVNAPSWSDPGIDAAFAAVLALLTAGLAAGAGG